MAKTKQDYVDAGKNAFITMQSYDSAPKAGWQREAWIEGWNHAQDERGLDVGTSKAITETSNVVTAMVPGNMTFERARPAPKKAPRWGKLGCVPPVVLAHIDALQKSRATEPSHARQARLTRKISTLVKKWSKRGVEYTC